MCLKGGRKGYSGVMREFLDFRLCWDEERRPKSLRGCSRAEAGRLMFLAERGGGMVVRDGGEDAGGARGF